MSEGERHDYSPIGTGKNWVTSVGGLPLMIRDVAHALISDGHTESNAIQLAVGAVQRWARGEGKVKPDTRAKAAAAISQWEAMKVASHAESSGKRDSLTEQTSAGLLVKVAPIPHPPKPRQADLLMSHAFRGKAGTNCTKCGKRASASIHRPKITTEGERHDIADHPMAVKPAAANPAVVRQRKADKDSFNADADLIEPKIHDAMTALFARQKAGTLSRLRGRRGRSMLKGNRADPPPQDSTTPPDAGAIFDPTFWAAETAKVITPIYARASELSAQRVGKQIGQPSIIGTGSLEAAPDIMRSRVNRMAQDVTDTTSRQIGQTLAEGTDKGENMTQLADRVSHVFDVASIARARNIARTESIGALNESSLDYAKSTGVVARKEWLAHHDNRTRLAHRVADTQTVPVDSPFHVGGYPMQFPGDPSAPADEVCQCRCGMKFHTSNVSKEAA